MSNEDIDQVEIVVPCGYRLDGKVTAEEQPVQMLKIDSFFRQHPISRLDLIKIDTDGWESHIIEGAAETLKEFHPDLVFELGPGNLQKVGRSADDLINILQELNYDFYRLDDIEPFESLDQLALELDGGDTINVIARSEERYAAVHATGHNTSRVA